MVESALCSAGIARLARRRHLGDTIILAYHNVVPDGERVTGDRSLHLAQRDFARQLDELVRTHDVVPLMALTEGRRENDRPRAVITFDDAYRGAVSAGVQELVRRGMPATIFVAPAFADGGSFWWDDLTLGQGAAEARSHALDELHGIDSAVRDWARSRGLGLARGPRHQTCASEAELHALEGTGITLGSHSWSHPVLPALPDDELRRELTAPITWLRERFTNFVPWLAYPYGLHSPRVVAAAREAGYGATLRIDGGWANHSSPPFDLPRMNVPAGVSLHGFELRIAGVIR